MLARTIVKERYGEAVAAFSAFDTTDMVVADFVHANADTEGQIAAVTDDAPIDAGENDRSDFHGVWLRFHVLAFC